MDSQFWKSCVCVMRPKTRRTASSAARLTQQAAKSDRRIPGRRDQPVGVAVLLDMTDRREGEMEPYHRRLFGGRHVVEFVARLLRQIAIDVERHVPIGIAQEQLWN